MILPVKIMHPSINSQNSQYIGVIFPCSLTLRPFPARRQVFLSSEFLYGRAGRFQIDLCVRSKEWLQFEVFLLGGLGGGGWGVGVGVANCHGNQIGVDIAFCLCEGSV